MANPIIEVASNAIAAKVFAAGLCVGIAAFGTAVGQGLIGAKACENIGLRPENAPAVSRMFGFAAIFVETSLLFSFVVAMMILYMI